MIPSMSDVYIASKTSKWDGDGWAFYFGAEEDFIHCRNQEITVQELIRRDRVRGFPPIKGHEGDVPRVRKLKTVWDVRMHIQFITDLIRRNMCKDRQLNFMGEYDGEDGGKFEPDDVVGEFPT